NDYMNCLWGNPTTEAEIPLIDAAAEIGCEYFCIDAGWYADGNWWDSVGEWNESKKRFPNGLKEVTDYIQKKGMIPGVWIEPEVMGIYCRLASNVPKDWFFVRHGKPVYDRSRFQLDYRNPEVRAYMDSVIDRLVDRKSTRLNSSHVSISYAVFCLKKKNHYTEATPTTAGMITPRLVVTPSGYLRLVPPLTTLPSGVRSRLMLSSVLRQPGRGYELA